MGLLIFKERSPDDKSPFRRNEYHVRNRSPPTASNESSHIIDGRISRIISPQPPFVRALVRERRSQRTRQLRQRSGIRLRPRHGEEMMNYLRQEDEVEPTTAADPVVQLPDITTRQVDDLVDNESTSSSEYDTAWHGVRGGTPWDEVNGINGGPVRRVIDSGASHIGPDGPLVATETFAPARHYYAGLQREQYFDVTPARGRAPNDGSRRGSFGAQSRTVSPDTQDAILREIRLQEDTENRSRLDLDGSAEGSTRAPAMTVSHIDGLGDRRRSLSHEDNLRSDTEENWTNLMETMPPHDEHLPSTGSSFASDTASSILSRSRPQSSFTNTPNSGSRAASAEAARFSDHANNNCPEAIDTQSGRFVTRDPRGMFALPPERNYSVLGPERASSRSFFSTTIPQETSNQLPVDRRHDLTALNDITSMIESGMDVPAEMWAAVGVSPYLGSSMQRHHRRHESL